MKWFLVAVGVFLGSFAVFLALPSSVLIQVRDVMENSLDRFTADLRPIMNRTAQRSGPATDGLRDRIDSRVNDRLSRVREEPTVNRASGRVESRRSGHAADGLRDRIDSRVSDRLSGVREEPTANRVSGRVESRRSGTSGTRISGIARVLDGDTLEIGSARVRLWGVDAPEGKQTCLDGSRRWPCGRRATQALAGRIDGRSVACEKRDHDGRVIAVCRHGGRDVNAWLVREGWALAYRRYTRTYVKEESAAKAAKRGLWRGEFVPPWDWRRGRRLNTAGRDTRHTASRDRGACNIKGNISRGSGRRIYHVPGDPDYAKTRISKSHGERWFCTESEARAAGWRRAGR